MTSSRHRSLALPLALAYAALVVYASLYPFSGWRWPPGQALAALAELHWPRWHIPFDIGSNLLGYLPLGALVATAARRGGRRAGSALLLGLALAGALSYSAEVLQQFLPGRVASLEDFVLNAAGALAGALLALLAYRLGLLDRWQALRQRWFTGESASALALLALWPLGLLFPTPVPLGLGQVGERLRAGLAEWLQDVPWAQAAHALLDTPAPAATPLRPLGESLIVALGLWAPCLVAYAVMRPDWRRAVVAVGALAVAFGGMTLSTLLNFGPSHALAWLAPPAGSGLALGTLLALAAAPLPRQVVAGAGLVALTGLVVGVAQAPADPYFAQSLQAWEQGQFVRFHGLAQWVGWLWPYVAMLWLLTRLGRREAPGPH
ncbi:MAG: VanZ family protein [Rubrivivax sp.]|nr:VanZ family protein [Rubrivivax sp.]